MDENTGEEQINTEQAQEEVPKPNACAKCGNPNYEEGYLTKLCTDCRDELARFPIPQWLKIAGGAVLLLVLIGMFFMARPLMAAIHLSKANKFMEQHKYQSAARELSQVTAVYPDNTDINAKAMIAYGHCYQSDSASYYYSKIEDKRTNDNALVDEGNALLKDYTLLSFTDSALNEEIAIKRKGPIEDFNRFTAQYMEDHPDDLPAKSYFASIYSSMGIDTKADTILTDIISRAPGSFMVYASIVPVKRDLGQLDEADKYADKMLEFNREDFIALSHKARIAIKRKDLKKAMEYAQKAYELQPKNSRSITTMVLVNHFAGKKDESQRYLAMLKPIELHESAGSDSTGYMWVDSIITGKKAF